MPDSVGMQSGLIKVLQDFFSGKYAGALGDKEQQAVPEQPPVAPQAVPPQNSSTAPVGNNLSGALSSILNIPELLPQKQGINDDINSFVLTNPDGSRIETKFNPNTSTPPRNNTPQPIAKDGLPQPISAKSAIPGNIDGLGQGFATNGLGRATPNEIAGVTAHSDPNFKSPEDNGFFSGSDVGNAKLANLLATIAQGFTQEGSGQDRVAKMAQSMSQGTLLQNALSKLGNNNSFSSASSDIGNLGQAGLTPEQISQVFGASMAKENQPFDQLLKYAQATKYLTPDAQTVKNSVFKELNIGADGKRTNSRDKHTWALHPVTGKPIAYIGPYTTPKDGSSGAALSGEKFRIYDHIEENVKKRYENLSGAELITRPDGTTTIRFSNPVDLASYEAEKRNEIVKQISLGNIPNKFLNIETGQYAPNKNGDLLYSPKGEKGTWKIVIPSIKLMGSQ